MKILEPIARLTNETDQFFYSPSYGIVLVFTENQVKGYLIISTFIICILLFILIIICGRKCCKLRRKRSDAVFDKKLEQPQPAIETEESRSQEPQKAQETEKAQEIQEDRTMGEIGILPGNPPENLLVAPLFCTPLFYLSKESDRAQ